MQGRITVVGSLNMDLIVRASRLPRPGETLLAGEFHTAPGGKGANQAVAAARLGADVSMIGRVGADDFGRALLDTLAADRVDTRFVTQDPGASTGVALIVVDDNGENTILVASGANMQVSPHDVEQAETALAGADLLLLQLELPLETVRRAAEIAKAHGVPVVLNPAPARPLEQGLLSLVDVLVPNEGETALLTGLPVSTQQEVAQAARRLLDLGVGRAVLTLGERGSFLASPEEEVWQTAFKIKPVDTTAAGDAFVGGFAVGLGEGRPAAEALAWGNAAGALAATKLGAQPSLPGREDMIALLQRGANAAPPGG